MRRGDSPDLFLSSLAHSGYRPRFATRIGSLAEFWDSPGTLPGQVAPHGSPPPRGRFYVRARQQPDEPPEICEYGVFPLPIWAEARILVYTV